ncbi:MAG: hypothetical protein ACI9WT_002007 [Flavobacterium sp.]|jgi:hypothetical protein
MNNKKGAFYGLIFELLLINQQRESFLKRMNQIDSVGEKAI